MLDKRKESSLRLRIDQRLLASVLNLIINFENITVSIHKDTKINEEIIKKIFN